MGYTFFEMYIQLLFFIFAQQFENIIIIEVNIAIVEPLFHIVNALKQTYNSIL
jgi:hypothetical protein